MSYIGSAPSRNTPAYKQVYEFVATAAQTTFSVAYTVGFVEVYRNGVKLGAPNFTANNGTSVVLTSGANAGDFIQIVSEFINPVLNAIPNIANSVADGNIVTVAASKLTGRVLSSNVPTGSVIQTVYGETADRTAWSGLTDWTDTGITATITPSSTSSRILVMVDGKFGGTNSGINFTLRLLRNGTVIYAGTDTNNKQGFAHFEQGWTAFQYFIMPANATTVDSPSSTSALTYKIQLRPNSTGSTIFMNRTDNNTASQANTRSSITLLEIAG